MNIIRVSAADSRDQVATMNFICKSCRDGKHSDCPGDTHCDCQHKRRRYINDGDN